MEENKTEYETKLEEYAQLLDIRAGRIRVSTSVIFGSFGLSHALSVIIGIGVIGIICAHLPLPQG